MIIKGSRYQDQQVVQSVNKKGISHPTVFAGTPQYPKNFTYHVVRQDDRLDYLAHRFLGDPRLWWKIADANPEFFYPAMLTPGSILRIPA